MSFGEIMNARCVKLTQRELGLDNEPNEYTLTENLVYTPDAWPSVSSRWWMV